MRHMETIDKETLAQVMGAQHPVHIGHGGEMLGLESPIERIESRDTLHLLLQVDLHEPYVVGKAIEEGPGEVATEHRYPEMGILCGQRIDHRHHHRHVAQRRKTDNQEMFVT